MDIPNPNSEDMDINMPSTYIVKPSVRWPFIQVPDYFQIVNIPGQNIVIPDYI